MKAHISRLSSLYLNLSGSAAAAVWTVVYLLTSLSGKELRQFTYCLFCHWANDTAGVPSTGTSNIWKEALRRETVHLKPRLSGRKTLKDTLK